MASHGGWNTTFGWDAGSYAANSGPAYGNPTLGGMPFGAPTGGGAGRYMMNPGAYNYYPGMTPMSYQHQQQAFPGQGGPGPAYVMPANGYHHAVPFFPGHGRPPQPHPVVGTESAAANLTNSTGGAGCEPGYNYFFPAEHTKVHVVKSTTAPWRVPASMALYYGAYHVPAGTTLAELMRGFGATNPVRKMNRVTELISGGNGRWYKGVTFSGEDADDLKKTLRDLGWDRSRTGRSGEKPVVWLWITKD